MSHEDIPILVVDDAKFSSAIIAKALRSGGFANVRFTNNPLQALRSIEKRPAQILIADWLMPSMDGLELTRRIKRTRWETPEAEARLRTMLDIARAPEHTESAP